MSDVASVAPPDAVGAGRRRGEFRVCGKHFFITYPRCPVAADYATSWFLSNYPEAIGLTVAREEHADGSPHLHVAVSFGTRKDVRNAQYFDFDFDGLSFHPNIQLARDLQSVLRYVTKYGDFTSEGCHVGVDVAQKVSRLAEIAKAAISGQSLLSLCNDAPGVFLLHKRKIEELVIWHQTQSALAALQATSLLIPSRLVSSSLEQISSLNASEREVLSWLGENIILGPRPFKQRQLYLYGPPNSGKTSLLALLMTVLPTYVMPMEDFYDLFDESMHKLVIMDEFRAQKTIQFLNQWADGQIMCVRKKGSQAIKSKNLPMVICSNFSIREAYSKTDDAHLEALLSRFICVRVEKLFSLIDLLKVQFSTVIVSDL